MFHLGQTNVDCGVDGTPTGCWSAIYIIIVQIPTHSIISRDMVDNFTKTQVVTLLFCSSETLFAKTSLSHFLELMSTENMPVQGTASATDVRENRLFPLFRSGAESRPPC